MPNRTKSEPTVARSWVLILGTAWLGIVASPRVVGAEPDTLTVLQATPAAVPAQQGVQGELQCTPRTGKGRIVCDASLSVGSGRLTWADLIVTKAPNFAPPLRDRVSIREASERSATRIRLPFALIAQQPGAGEVTIKARAVWCKPGVKESDRELCVPITTPLSAAVVASPESSPATR